MATGSAGSASAKAPRREQLGAVNAYLEMKDPVLCVFREIGDRFRGTVVDARIVDTVIGERERKNAAGAQKKHLQVYLTSPEGEKLVLDFRSQNQKESLVAALEKAGISGLAKGDFLSTEYVGDDDVLRDGLSPARRFVTEIEPAA